MLEPGELEKLGCGGILGVGGGSANGPRLVKLTWAPEDARASVAFVGKGVTYDSGGLTIKPGSSMATMKYDMGGAAAVLAATFAIAELGLPVGVTTYAPMAENMVSGDAMRPGDVLTMYDGQTVEVTNTDAEGRLILADALAMAAEGDHDAIIDVATLTGPCIVALGEKVAGVFGDDDTTAAVEAAAEVSGEMLWRLPIPDETHEAVRTESKIADLLQHNWVRWGSALFAAAFLERVRRRQAVGPPRHRRAGVQRERAVGARAVRCHRLRDPDPGRLRSQPGRGRRRVRRRGRGPRRGLTRSQTGSWPVGCGRRGCFCRRLYSRIRDGIPTSPASYDGTPLRLAKSCAHFTDGTRRRVHSPSCATSNRVTSVTVVRGSTKPSTPRRELDELLQVALVAVVGRPHRGPTAGVATAAPSAEAIEQTHGPSVLHRGFPHTPTASVGGAS